MGSDVTGVPAVGEIQELYDSNRFLEAHEATGSAWESPELLNELHLEELVLGARLAQRLGSYRIAWYLYRRAREIAPDAPLLRFYGRGFLKRRMSFYDYLSEYEELPELGSDDPELEALWCASHAAALARVRDFRRAAERMQAARDLERDDYWIDVCESDIHVQKGQWQQALELAESAWNKSHGAPAAAAALAAALDAQGRSSEAARRLLDASLGNGQSFEVLEQALQLAIASLERGDRDLVEAIPGGIYAATAHVYELAPLCDKRLARRLECLRADAARVERKLDRFVEHAGRTRIPFYESVAKNVESSGDGERVVLEHEKLRQQHNTCLPASLVTCASVFGEKLDQEALAEKMTFAGTAMWRLLAWAEESGWKAVPFLGEEASCVALLDAGIPFILHLRNHAFAHAVAAIGYDRAAGTLLLHDPSTGRLGEVLLEHVGDGEAPLGPECIALTPPDASERLRNLALGGELFARTFLDLARTCETDSFTAARAVAEAFVQENPEAPQTAYLRAWIASESGNSREAVEAAGRILAEHKDCHLAQSLLLHAAASSGDTAYYREVLESIVRRGRLPSHDSEVAWVYPEPTLQARYADLLAQSETHFDEALAMLDRALFRGPFHGEIYHYLADVLWRRDEKDRALLAFRLASSLESENEHYAASYAGALRKCGRTEEGIAWLEERVERFTGEAGGGSAWITLVQTLEQFGQFRNGLETLRRGLTARPRDAELAGFAVHFLSNYGKFEEADEALARCRELGTKSQALDAATTLAARRGELEQALEHAEAWVAESPRDIRARETLAELVGAVRGAEAAQSLLQGWFEEFTANEGFEHLLLEHFREACDDEARLEILRRRVERNPFDAWAWRELAWQRLSDVHRLPEKELEAGLEEVRELARECIERGPREPGTLGLLGEIAVIEKRFDDAIEHFTEALHALPSYDFYIHRLFELAANRPVDERRFVIEILDEAFSLAAGDLTAARSAAMGLARLLGRDEALAALERWNELSPDDPIVAEAWADVELQFGVGREALEAVVSRLEPLVERYPLRGGMAFSLASAYQSLYRFDDAIERYEKLLALQPGWVQARLALVTVLERTERFEEAQATLEKGLQITPRDAGLQQEIAEYLVRRGRTDEALERLAATCETMPSVMDLWERRIGLLLENDRQDEALEVARSLGERYPDGAYAVLILARTLRATSAGAARKEIDETFAKAVDLNARFWDASWEYAVYLMDQAKFDRAQKALQDYQKLCPDELCVKGALAYLTWRRGEFTQAIEEMRRILLASPDYQFGWSTLIDWIETELSRNAGAQTVAREILPSLPAQALDDAYIACRRLLVMEQASFGFKQLAPEWRELVDRFPALAPLHARYFDFLFRNEKPGDAEKALEAIVAFEPDDPGILARRVVVACWKRNESEAIDVFRRILERQDDLDGDSAQALFFGVGQGGLAEPVVEATLSHLRTGHRVAHSILWGIVVQLAGQGGYRKAYRQLLEELEPERHDWDTTDAFAMVLEAYINSGGAVEVLKWSERHRKLCESNTAVWQLIGHAHSTLDRNEDTWKWLSSWRDHENVEQWTFNHLAAACFELGRFAEAMEVCRYSLEHSAFAGNEGNLAEIYLRSALEMRDRMAYRKAFARYHSILRARPDRQESSRALEFFDQALQTTDPRKLKQLHQQSRTIRQASGWATPTWKQLLSRRLSGLSWLLFKLGTWGG